MHHIIFIFLVHIFPATTSAHELALEPRQAGIVGCTTFLHQLQEIVFGQPVALTTSITANTTFTGPYGRPITVTNAPTLLNTTYTAFSTTTSTSDVKAQDYQESKSLPGLSDIISTLPTGSPVIPPIVIPGISTGTSKQGSSAISSISTSSSFDSVPPVVSPPSPSSTSSGGVNILNLNLGLSLEVASSVCGVAGSSPDGTCLQTLPPECLLFSSATLLGALLDTVDLLACEAALGVLGTANAAACFTGDLVQSLIGVDVLNCIQSHVPMCQSCLPALPSVCANLGLTVASLSVAQIGLCQSALGLFGTGVGQSCFLNAQASLLGINLLSCLQANIPICPTKVLQPPRSLLSTIIVTGCDGQPTPTTCVTALPDACRPATSGLLGTVIGLVNPLLCQTALGALGTLNAAACFVDGLLSSLTGTDLTSCLYNHLPMCDNCVSRLPAACQPDSGLTGALCQVALGVYGVSTAATCFVGGILEALVGQDLTDCLNALLPYCATAPLETITQIGGDAAYTSTVTSTANLLGLLDGPTTTFVVVNQPASPVDLRTTTRTGGSALYTSTVTYTGNLFGFLDITTTTYIVVNVPTIPAVLDTVTQTSGTTDFTSTVTSTIALLGLLDVAYTTYVLVNKAAPTTPLSTSTRTSGSVNFTSTVTATENLLGLVNGATTTYVLVNQATTAPTLSTSTQSSGSVGFTSIVTSTIGGLLGLLPTTATYVLVNKPTISTSTTTFLGSSGYTSTITSTQVTEVAFTLVVVGVPTALPTTTIRSGTANEPFTQTVGVGLSAVVEVILPTTPPVLATSFTTFVGSIRYTSTVTSTIPGLLGLLPVTTTFVLIGVPIAAPTTTISSGSLPEYTTTVGAGASATVRIVVPTPPPVLATSTTTFVGSVPFTSTVTVVNPGLLGLLPSTTTFVLVGVPTTLTSPAVTSDSVPEYIVVPTPPPELATSTTTFIGSVPFTSTVTVINPGLLGLLPSASTFVLVGVPTTLPTTLPITPASYSEPAYIIVPPGPGELVTSTITYVGSETYTSTVTAVNPGLLGLLPSTITYVLVGIPTTLPTTTVTSGSAPQFTTTVGVGIAATVQIVVPTPPPVLPISYTAVTGSVGFTRTVTSVKLGLLGLLPTTTTFVLIGVPKTGPTGIR